MMKCSASYDLLFKVPFRQVEDNEKAMRLKSFTFERQNIKKFAPHKFSFTGIFQPMSLRFYVETIILFLVMSFTQLVCLQVYSTFKSAKFTQVMMMLMMG